MDFGTNQYLSVRVGGVTKTVREHFNTCPSWLNVVLSAFVSANKASSEFYSRFIPESARNHPIAWILDKSSESSLLDPAVFDKYTLGMTATVIHLALRKGAKRQSSEPSDLISIPSQQDFLDRLYVNAFRGSAFPEIDADPTGFFDAAFEFGETCILDTFREMPVDDGILSGVNSWDTLLQNDPKKTSHCPDGKSKCTKKEFIMGVFADYHTSNGNPAYPQEQIDFRSLYYKLDLWEDATETFVAFEHLAMHRTKILQGAQVPTLDGQSATYVVSTSALGGLAVRAGFAHLGADMFFSSSKEPIMVRTPQGTEIWRSEAPSATWQYWKFVWRSSVALYITLVDHLWMTHMSAANALAAASREGLPPVHPLRRLLTIFTHGSIAVNNGATHQLIGPDHLLQRSTPFQDFHEVAQAAHSLMMSMKDAFGAFVDDDIFQTVDPSLQTMALYEDGRLLFQGIDTLVTKWVALYSNQWCDNNGNIKDDSIKLFMNRIDTWTLFDRTAASDNEWLGLYTIRKELTCNGFYKWLKTMLFAVSAYHRQVGTVADLASDPDFASFSNAEGEAFGRPQQHMLIALVAATTGSPFPKVTSDYSFLAEGLGSEASNILHGFQADMRKTALEVDRRNEQRVAKGGLPYLQMHPRYVESSVAV